jgi:Putative restriction endonuclease
MTRPARPPAGLFAPGADGAGASLRLPAVDDRLAPPETRLEYLGGVELFAAPADPPHATQHFDLTYLLGAHVAPGYRGAVDLLSRTDEVSDFAPDASVYADEPDPATGGRRLEELAFEVSDKQKLAVSTKKARELVRRGVRRVFCLRVGRKRLLEWSRESDDWQPVDDGAAIVDRCLARPLPVRALLGAVSADEAVVAALAARRVPALEALVAAGEAEGEARGRAKGEAKGRAEGEARGRAEGLRVAVADLCEVLGVALGPARRAQLASMGVGELEALRAALKATKRWPG